METNRITKQTKVLIDLIADGQSGKYKHFVRHFSGKIRQIIELRNPLLGSLLVIEIDSIIEIINPKLEHELQWLKYVNDAVKLWCNEKVIANRLLGLKNDNEYDVRVFEKVVMEKFFMQLKEKPDHTAIIETDFRTMVELVELGARRFGH